MSTKLIRVLFYLLVNFLCLCRKTGLWKFPSGLRAHSGKYLRILAAGVAAQLAKRVKNKKYTNETSSLMENPFLRFHANYSLTHVDLNTPCTRSLAIDLASCIDLSDKKILCLGSRNLDEIFQLQLAGAKANNITAVDLYSEFPEILPMDFQDLKFKDSSFDIIFWAGSYAYAEDPILALSEAFRVLKRPGIFALGDTYIGEATKESYNAKQSDYMVANPELNSSLDELPKNTTLTKGLKNLDEIKARVDSFGVDKFILARDYFSTPHYNIIASVK